MTNRTLTACALIALAGLPAAANAQIKGIFCNDPTRSNNVVPTLGGPFAVGTGSATAFDHPYLSPDGLRWIINAIKEDATDDKDVLIVGGGTTGAGAATVAVEDVATSFDPLRTYALIDGVCGINNAGQYVFTADLDGATTDDEVMVLFDGTTQSAAAREGAASPIAGQNFGSAIDSAHILNNGTPRYRTTLAPTTTKMIIASGSTVLGETDVTTPTGQLVAPDQTVDLFTVNRFTSSGDGAHYMAHGDLNGATTTDLFMLVDGAVVAQEGAPLPGGVFGAVNVTNLYTDIGSQQMSPSGAHWAFRSVMADGTGATATDLVIKNGALIAKTGDPIVPSSTELWDDVVFSVTFFVNTVNDNGDMVYGGVTNNADVNLDGVIVYKPAGGDPVVLAREGDPIDLDGNGILDDDAFIDIFGNDDGVLTSDGKYYFIASIQNSLNVSTGNAFLVMNVPTPPPACYADCDGVGGLTANDFACFLTAYINGQSYANCDGVGGLTANDFVCFLTNYNNGCS
jgi:hypothetical protein